jgi:hypothetical protein
MPEITTNRNNFYVGANVSMRTTKSGGTEMNYIELAKQANGGPVWNGMEWLWEDLQKFAKLVAAHEREACAKVCEDLDAWNMDDPASTAVTAIRARGEA